ncbi:MAG: hypothetical protein A2W23_06420 [Planctomycetes bacterium RBG_16_43_13]|nr:MAG: hypothetical protein A2W23_06420 [Planctomycetes bacterium RBG_16_43_13]
MATKKIKPVPAQTIIQDCNFESHNEVIWDKSVLATVDKVAQGLLNLTELFTAQKIVIEAMVKISDGDTTNAEISGKIKENE